MGTGLWLAAGAAGLAMVVGVTLTVVMEFPAQPEPPTAAEIGEAVADRWHAGQAMREAQAAAAAAERRRSMRCGLPGYAACP